MKHFIHFYYGNREEAFYTALGTAIRAKGHSLPVNFFLIDKQYHWITHLKKISSFVINILNLSDLKKGYNFRNNITGLRDTFLVIANIDLLLEEEIVNIDELVGLLSILSNDNEIIVTSLSYLQKLADLADYVSSFSVN